MPVPVAASSAHSSGKVRPPDAGAVQAIGTGCSSSRVSRSATRSTPRSHPTRPPPATVIASTSTSGCRSRKVNAARSSPPRSVSTTTGVAPADVGRAARNASCTSPSPSNGAAQPVNASAVPTAPVSARLTGRSRAASDRTDGEHAAGHEQRSTQPPRCRSRDEQRGERDDVEVALCCELRRDDDPRPAVLVLARRRAASPRGRWWGRRRPGRPRPGWAGPAAASAGGRPGPGKARRCDRRGTSTGTPHVRRQLRPDQADDGGAQGDREAGQQHGGSTPAGSSGRAWSGRARRRAGRHRRTR